MRRGAIALALLLAVPGAFVGLQATRAWVGAVHEFDPYPEAFRPPSPLEGHQAVVMRGRSGHQVAASWVPPKNGVAVILGHGARSNRTQLWGDAKTLAGAGFGVLLFDWPGHGESEGELVYGHVERDAFTAVVDFVAAQPGVQRIGAFGFSNGGGLMSAFVPDEPRVTSLLAVNAWSDLLEQTRYKYRKWGLIRQLPAELAARRGIEDGNLSALDVAPKLKGRRTLFIASTNDASVPPSMTEALARAAGSEPRLVAGATHNDFREKMGDWNRVLVQFFSQP